MRVFIPALSKIKNQPVSKLLFLALAVCAGLLSGCENEFVKSAVATLNPEPSPPRVTLEWDADVVYIDPLNYTLSGTISGLLNNAGNRVWFSKTENLVLGRDWDVPKPPQELAYEQTGDSPDGFITAGSIAAFVVGPVTTDGDKIDVILNGTVAKEDTTVFDPDLYDNGGVSYSFVLKPTAFYGADRDTAIGEKQERLFTLELPTKTFYSKVVMERTEYGSVSVSWADGAAANLGEPWQGMMDIAGGLAAGSASAAVAAWDATSWVDTGYIGVTVDGSTGEDGASVQLAAVSWNTRPDTSKSYAPYNKYAIVLSPYSYDEDSDVTGPVQPVVSLAVEFTSEVGNAVTAIKAAEKAGSFSIPYQAPSEDDTPATTKTALEGLISSCAADFVTIDSSSSITWSPEYSEPSSAPKMATAYTLTIVVGPGKNDGSTADTITVTAVIRPPESQAKQ